MVDADHLALLVTVQNTEYDAEVGYLTKKKPSVTDTGQRVTQAVASRHVTSPSRDTTARLPRALRLSPFEFSLILRDGCHNQCPLGIPNCITNNGLRPLG